MYESISELSKKVSPVTFILKSKFSLTMFLVYVESHLLSQDLVACFIICILISFIVTLSFSKVQNLGLVIEASSLSV